MGRRQKIVCEFFVVCAIFISIPQWASAVSDPPVGALGDDGWTTFQQHAGSQSIYVSESQGNDRYCDGLSPTPFSGSSTSQSCPKKTLKAAKLLLRSGNSDWLLLRRGDEWTNESFGQWTISGLSALEPVVVGAYGDGERPIVSAPKGAGIRYTGKEPLSNIAITGIHFRRGGTQVSVRWVGPTTNLLLEDCAIEQAAVIQAKNFGDISNVAIRRSIIVDAWNPNTVQGVTVGFVHGILLEENIIDRNGYIDADGDVGPSDTVHHNILIQKNSDDVAVRGNIISRAPSHGLQTLSAGTIENNLFLQNATAALYQTHEAVTSAGSIRNNVVLLAKDIARQDADTLFRGFGFEFRGVLYPSGAQTVVSGNIIAQEKSAGDAPAAFILSGNQTVHDVLLENNVSYQAGEGLQLAGKPGVGLQGIAIRGNTFHNADSGQLLVESDKKLAGSGVVFSENRYFLQCPEDTADCAKWFRNAGELLDWNTWVQRTGEEGSSNQEVSFVDPNRTIESYMQGLIHQGSLAAENLSPTLDSFFAEARKQSRGHWLTEFTASKVNSYFREGFAEAERNAGSSDTTPPQVPTLIVPELTTTTFSLHYSGAADLGSGLAMVKLWVRKDSGEWTDTGMQSSTSDGVFDYHPALGQGHYGFFVVAVDSAGNSTPLPDAGQAGQVGIYDSAAPSVDGPKVTLNALHRE